MVNIWRYCLSTLKIEENKCRKSKTKRIITHSQKKKKKKKENYYCGGRSFTEIIKVKLIGPVAHPRMQTCPRRPILDWKCNQTKGRVNITKGEFSIRPRTEPFSAIWVRGRSGCHLVTNVPRSYVTTKGGIRGQRWEREKANKYLW